MKIIFSALARFELGDAALYLEMEFGGLGDKFEITTANDRKEQVNHVQFRTCRLAHGHAEDHS
jgi:hypothetical protein